MLLLLLLLRLLFQENRFRSMASSSNSALYKHARLLIGNDDPKHRLEQIVVHIPIGHQRQDRRDIRISSRPNVDLHVAYGRVDERTLSRTRYKQKAARLCEFEDEPKVICPCKSLGTETTLEWAGVSVFSLIHRAWHLVAEGRPSQE